MSGEATVKGTRLSLSDILALMLTRPSRGEEAVTLKANAKGDTQIEVTGREREGETLADVAARVSAVYDALDAQYPLMSDTRPSAEDGVERLARKAAAIARNQ